MKKTIIIIAAALLCLPLSAQLSADYYREQYIRQVRNTGYAGLGVETILDRWALAYPDDLDMLIGRFNYYFTKSQSTQVVPKNQEKFMGNKPALSLLDSTGHKVNYFEEYFFDEDCLAMANKAIDRAIALDPDNLEYRFDKISALLSYEKENPELTEAEIMKMIDNPVGGDAFPDAIQDWCSLLFRVGSPASYEAFRRISERMLKLYPSKSNFLANTGTYALIVDKNYKKAIKIYDKVLKINPDDEAAQANRKIAVRMLSRKKK